jgi:hypothetical protein
LLFLFRYLFTAEEEEAWHAAEPSERPLPFIPRKHGSLREVGGYANLALERHERCLDLYLCPRAFKRRLNIDPEARALARLRVRALARCSRRRARRTAWRAHTCCQDPRRRARTTAWGTRTTTTTNPLFLTVWNHGRIF